MVSTTVLIEATNHLLLDVPDVSGGPSFGSVVADQLYLLQQQTAKKLSSPVPIRGSAFLWLGNAMAKTTVLTEVTRPRIAVSRIYHYLFEVR